MCILILQAKNGRISALLERGCKSGGISDPTTIHKLEDTH